MNPPNPISSSSAMQDVIVKRKRGRPRKDRSQIPVKSTFVSHQIDQNQHQGAGEGAPIPPGYEEVNGSQQQPPVDTIKNSKEDSAVDQVVTSVIEVTFDAGYLLSVHIGDSETSLRGVVFKPGHNVPVSAENDVAPSLQMIQRNEVPFPSGNQGRKRQGKEKIDHNYNQLTKARASQLSIVPVQPSHLVGERGAVVPVILQPVSLSNGAIPAVVSTAIISQTAVVSAFSYCLLLLLLQTSFDDKYETHIICGLGYWRLRFDLCQTTNQVQAAISKKSFEFVHVQKQIEQAVSNDLLSAIVFCHSHELCVE